MPSNGNVRILSGRGGTPIPRPVGDDRVPVEMTSYALSKGRIVFSVPGPDKAQLVRADAATGDGED